MESPYTKKLRDDISDLKENTKNWEKKPFIPINSLRNLLQENVITGVIKESGIEAYDEKEAVQAVLRGGQRVFGILSVIEREDSILDFIKTDGFLKRTLDSGLPYEEHVVKTILPGCYREFYDRQWEFAAPVFERKLLHRRLHEYSILPFTEVEDLADGGFSKVSRVTLSGLHQQIDRDTTGTVQVIRKQLTNSSHRDFEHEQHILSLLRALQHPNIVQFYTAFSIGSEFALLFAPADCNLKQFLRTGGDSDFSDQDMIDALFGLSSALHKVHDYLWEEHDLRMIGCHYDLHPGNILVKDRTFILSDFGLSRLKAEAQGSRSSFKGGVRDYYAPECQDWADSFKRSEIGRPSDIWSFGCILAEIATFVQLPLRALEEFDSKRKNGNTYGTFHNNGERHTGVMAWLDDLERSPLAKDITKGLVSLIRDMLAIKQSERPRAQQVSARLFFVAQKMRYDAATEKLEKMPPDVDFRFTVEHHRLKIWANHVGLGGTAQDMPNAHSDFEKIQTLLREIEESIPVPPEPGQHHVIRASVDNLWQTQPLSVVCIMYRELESFILRDDTETRPVDPDSLASYPRPQLLLGMKQALDAVKNYEESQGGLLVEQSTLKERKDWNHKLLARMDEPDQQTVFTLTEFLQYDDDWIDHEEELIARVSSLASILRRLKLDETFHVLRCRNFCHFPERQAYGLIYQISDRFINGEPKPITLAHMIERTVKRQKRPSLGEIFMLAYQLATTVLSFHKALWLHKGISSYDILFFPSNPEAPGDSISSVRLTGFSYSRQSGKNNFTVGPLEDNHLRDYRHPKYRKDAQRVPFREEFDYYSLGIVLLELGRWKLMSEMTKSNRLRRLSPSELQDHLVSEEVSQLRSFMGRYYQDAVEACLVGVQGENSEGAWGEFEKKVVQPLQKCLPLHPEADQIIRPNTGCM